MKEMSIQVSYSLTVVQVCDLQVCKLQVAVSL